MSFLQDSSVHIEAAIGHYGVIIIFLVLFLESFGVPMPGESGLIAASLLASRGDISIAGLYIAAVLAAVLGDSTGYLIGRFGGRRLLQKYGRLVKLTPERLTKIEGQFARRGALVVVVARFIVILRQLNGIVAGSIGMPWPRFVVANIVGAVLWVGVWGLGPYFFGSFFKKFIG